MVSVIIPIYVPSVSTFEILKDCVNSVIQATDSDFQLILINDKCKKFVDIDKRIFSWLKLRNNYFKHFI